MRLALPLFALTLASCARHREPAPAAATPSAVVVASFDAGPPAFTKAQWTDLLAGYFGKYSSGSFAFLKDYDAPVLDQFITMKNVTVDQAIEASTSFFKDKTGVEYLLDTSTIAVTPDGAGDAVDCDVYMAWTHPLAKDVPAAVAEPIAEQRYSAHVTARLRFDAQHKLVSYVETKVHPERLRVLPAQNDQGHLLALGGRAEDRWPGTYGPDGCVQAPKGTLVEDLHESFIIHDQDGATFRRVRYKGKVDWVIESATARGYVDGNGYDQSVTLGFFCLEPEHPRSLVPPGSIDGRDLASPIEARLASVRTTTDAGAFGTVLQLTLRDARGQTRSFPIPGYAERPEATYEPAKQAFDLFDVGDGGGRRVEVVKLDDSDVLRTMEVGKGAPPGGRDLLKIVLAPKTKVVAKRD